MANNNDNNDLQDLEHLMDAPTPMDDDRKTMKRAT